MNLTNITFCDLERLWKPVATEWFAAQKSFNEGNYADDKEKEELEKTIAELEKEKNLLSKAMKEKRKMIMEQLRSNEDEPERV